MRRILFMPGLLLSLISIGFADDVAVSGRKIIDKWREVVIQVKLVVEVSDYENKSEALATVIDPSGLAVISLSSIDPNRAGGEYETAPALTSKIKDLKMILPDGNELPAQVVLRDPDLDLAFIKPLEKFTKPAPFLDLTDSIKPEILTPFIILSRLGATAGRDIVAPVSRIQAVIKKPRTMYIPDMNGMMSGLAAPAFSLDGKVLGIVVLRVAPSEPGMNNEMFGGMGSMNVIPVIMPAATILETVKKIPK